MLATIRDNTRHVLNMQHIVRRWLYTQIWSSFSPPWDQIFGHGAENRIISEQSPNKHAC